MGPEGGVGEKCRQPSPGRFAVFGLGANQGDAVATLAWALAELSRAYGPLEVAPLYRTAPVSALPQDDYYNTVALAPLPEAPPAAVLAHLKELERRAGRVDGPRDGPRPLDIDLLCYGDLVLNCLPERPKAAPTPTPPPGTGEGKKYSPPPSRGEGPGVGAPTATTFHYAGDLVLPHPRLRLRRFVLAPLADLAPGLALPPDGRKVADLLADLDRDPATRAQRVERCRPDPLADHRRRFPAPPAPV